MSCLIALFAIGAVAGLTLYGLDSLFAAQAHGESLLWPFAFLAVPLLVLGWIVVRIGTKLFDGWKDGRGAGQKAIVLLLSVVLVGGGLAAYVQSTVSSQRPSAQLTAALGPACRGEAVAGAGQVDLSGARINHMVVLDNEGNEHVWTGFQPIEWRPASIDDADYVACVSAEETHTVIEVCRYGNGPDITRYRATRRVRIVEALTGVQVADYTLKDDPRNCQQTEQRDLTELKGEVSWGMLAAECSEWVKPGTASATSSPGPDQQSPRPTRSTRPSPTTSPAEHRIDLAQAIERGLVEATITGDGLQSVQVEMTSMSSDTLTVVVPAATWFDPQHSTTQSMVAIATLEIALAADESGTWSVDVACGKMRRDQPAGDDRFTIRAQPASGDLALLLASPGFADLEFRVQQFAVWTLTNDPSRGGYVGLGTQFSVFGSGPTKEEFAAIRDTLEQAGVDPGDYRAFR